MREHMRVKTGIGSNTTSTPALMCAQRQTGNRDWSKRSDKDEIEEATEKESSKKRRLKENGAE